MEEENTNSITGSTIKEGLSSGRMRAANSLSLGTSSSRWGPLITRAINASGQITVNGVLTNNGTESIQAMSTRIQHDRKICSTGGFVNNVQLSPTTFSTVPTGEAGLVTVYDVNLTSCAVYMYSHTAPLQVIITQGLTVSLSSTNLQVAFSSGTPAPTKIFWKKLIFSP